MEAWRNRIVGYGELAVEEALYNPANWRIHPMEQQRVLAGVLKDVGIVQNILVNKRTGHLVDGHLRILLADREGVKALPATFVDLTEAEEMEVLATLDPVAAMAATDHEKMVDIIANLGDVDAEVRKMLDRIEHTSRYALTVESGGSSQMDSSFYDPDSDELQRLKNKIAGKGNGDGEMTQGAISTGRQDIPEGSDTCPTCGQRLPQPS